MNKPALIDVSDLDTYELIAALYNRAEPGGRGFLAYTGSTITPEQIRHDIEHANLNNTAKRQIENYFAEQGWGKPKFLREKGKRWPRLTLEIAKHIEPFFPNYTLSKNGAELSSIALIGYLPFGWICLNNYRGTSTKAILRIAGDEKWLNPDEYDERTQEGALQEVLLALREGKAPPERSPSRVHTKALEAQARFANAADDDNPHVFTNRIAKRQREGWQK